MNRNRTNNFVRRIAAVAAAVLLISGCNTSPTSPDDGTDADAPKLPVAEKLHFPELGFFDGADKDAASKANFFNAAIRVAIVEVVAEFVMTPPIAAFALAIHTVPSHQDDGSWIWVYTFVDGDEEAQIRLRAMPHANHTEWELRVTAMDESPPINNEVWFEGETSKRGKAGFWRFHDFHRDGKPVVARIDWDHSEDGEELVFTDLYENPGNELAYRGKGKVDILEFVDANGDDDWKVLVDQSDGTGYVQASDYNGGERACWDEDQEDTICDMIVSGR